jgi:DNA-binding XRE family transcriptional regulator
MDANQKAKAITDNLIFNFENWITELAELTSENEMEEIKSVIAEKLALPTIEKSVESILSAHLKFLRKKHNLTQQKVADQIGVSQSAYAFYETGKKQPKYGTLLAISNFYGVTTDYLLGNPLTQQLPKLIPRTKN